MLEIKEEASSFQSKHIVLGLISIKTTNN